MHPHNTCQIVQLCSSQYFILCYYSTSFRTLDQPRSQTQPIDNGSKKDGKKATKCPKSSSRKLQNDPAGKSVGGSEEEQYPIYPWSLTPNLFRNIEPPSTAADVKDTYMALKARIECELALKNALMQGRLSK